MKGKMIKALAVALMAVGLFGAVDLVTDAKAIYEGTVRLHVLAHSDSEEDQALKLKVRDALLGEMDALLATSEASDADSAEKMLSENLEAFKLIAEEVIAENGFDYAVQIALTEEYYETRTYEGFSLPAGEYASLQVRIGEAAGQNWWCVLFPPLCTTVASAEEELAETGFSKRQVRLLTENEQTSFQLRFKMLEWFGEVGHKLKEVFD